MYILIMGYELTVLKLIESNQNISDIEWHFSLSLRLGIFSFVALLIYTKNILTLLNPFKIINIFSQDVTRDSLLELKCAGDDGDPLQPIIDIIIMSLEKHDRPTMSAGFKAIKLCCKSMYGGKAFKVGQEEKLSEILETHFDQIIRFNEEWVNLQLISAIEQVGISATESKCKSTTEKMASSLRKLGIDAFEQKSENILVAIVDALEELGQRAAPSEELLITNKTICNSLRDIGNLALGREFEGVVHSAVITLARISETAAASENIQVLPISIKSLRDIGEFSIIHGNDVVMLDIATQMGEIAENILGREIPLETKIGIVDSLRALGVTASDKGREDDVKIIVDTIENICKKAIQSDDSQLIEFALDSLEEIGNKMITKKLMSASFWVINSIKEIRKLAIEARMSRQITEGSSLILERLKTKAVFEKLDALARIFESND